MLRIPQIGDVWRWTEKCQNPDIVGKERTVMRLFNRGPGFKGWGTKEDFEGKATTFTENEIASGAIEFVRSSSE